jgi:homogentisate phytyltransferase / homogentisate geranylgeranyltransferase
MHILKTLWEFSRPHTIIGSFLSILALYAISVAVMHPENTVTHLPDYTYVLMLTLLSALSCNVYITGLNQVQDVDLDLINKPWLPIPAGNLSLKKAKTIIVIALAISLVTAALANWILLVLILVIAAVGTAYSLPPLKFKRHHIAAAASILLVRGLLVNIGMPLQFLYSFSGELFIPEAIWPLVIFVMGFSLAIAWFKDIPDVKGDDTYQIKTLALSLSAQAAFRYGVAVVSLSYIALLFLSVWLQMQVNETFFFVTHGLLLLLFWLGASKVSIENPDNLKRFYIGFWVFFFAEYIIYPISFYL